MVDTLSLHTSDARERIKAAASRIFSLHGLEGARMQDIADEAKINKAMLHYYFRNKQQLFEMIFEEKVYRIFSAIEALTAAGASFEERIRTFVHTQISIVTEFPAMPLFIFLEARKNPGLLDEKFGKLPVENIRTRFKNMVKAEAEAGNIREISFDQLFINIMSLCVYPVIAEPVIRHVLDKDESSFRVMVEARKKLVADLIINDLKPRDHGK